MLQRRRRSRGGRRDGREILVENKISKEYHMGCPLLEPPLNKKGLGFWVKGEGTKDSMPKIIFGILCFQKFGDGIRKRSGLSHA